MEQLIDEVRARPVLWDINLDCYRDGNLKETAWNDVATALGMTQKDAKAEWRKLRDRYRQAMFRKKTKSGQAAAKTKPWIYEKNMEFLIPAMAHRTSDSNIPSLETALQDTNPEEDDLPMTSAVEDMSDGDDRNSEVSAVSARNKPGESRIRPPRKEDKILNFLQEKEKRKKSAPEPDDLDLFFASVCKSTRKLPRFLQTKVKMQILQVISKAEEDEWHSQNISQMPYPTDSGSSNSYQEFILSPNSGSRDMSTPSPSLLDTGALLRGSNFLLNDSTSTQKN